MDGADDSGAELDVAPRSRRRRSEGPEGGLSVAELLARNGVDPRAATQSSSGSRRRHAGPDDAPDPWAEPPGRVTRQSGDTGWFEPAVPPEAWEPEPRAPEPVPAWFHDEPGSAEWGAAQRTDPQPEPVSPHPPAHAPDAYEPGHYQDEYQPEPPEPSEYQPETPEPAAHQPEPPEVAHEPEVAQPEVREAEPPREDSDAGDDPDDQVGFELRAARIDESLTRLTAIHAGLGREMTERVSRTGRFPLVTHPVAEAERAEDAEDVAPGAVRANRHPGWIRAGRLTGLVAALAVFLATGVGWGVQTWLNRQLRSVLALDPNASTVVDRAAQSGDQNYLLAGTGAGGLTSVMLVHVPAKVNRVVVVSFPTGLTVDRPSCDRWDPASASYPGGTSPAQSGATLTASYAVGGPRCLTKTIQQLTGLLVNHYTGVDLAAVAPMVDAVHGVPVCLAGGPSTPTVLAGAQALGFLGLDPAAASSALAGNVGPDQRQQLFVWALLGKATSDAVLPHLDQLRAFVTAYGAHALGDNAGLAELGELARWLRNTDPAKVLLTSVPLAGPPKGLFDAIRAGGPLPGQDGVAGTDDSTAGAGPSAAGALPPSAVTVTVRNSTSRAGLANQAADLLRTLGFTVASVGDAPRTAGGRTVIRHSADRAAAAATLAEAVPSAVSETVPGARGLLDLVLGDNYDGQIRAVASAAGAGASGGVHTLSALTGPCH